VDEELALPLFKTGVDESIPAIPDRTESAD